ncbi:dnaJ homolog subfamily B member 8 [Indicator indicator]|uniref:dnaJ homolog subfamily B member 8 n=1 Tax=Indicator indicator TaxID=1002788 RepID=UPI0023DF572E|nr:dnaJ homolog subfamily B member 8 [Indicator indicator]
MVDYYAVLGLNRSASQDDVKKSYHQLALKWHPDKNPSNKLNAEKKFKEIAEAYTILSDPQKRLDYDRSVQESPASFYVFHEVFDGMEVRVHFFYDHFANMQNLYWRRERSSQLPPDFMEPFTPWNLFSPSEQFASSFAEDISGSYDVRSVSTSTEEINGKKITIQKIIENGQERMELEEDGQLRSATVNGIDHLK